MKKIRFLHTADWHLGKYLYERTLIEDQRALLDQFLKVVKEQDPDFILFAGDLYDRSIPSSNAIALMSQFLAQLRRISQAPFILISGNHDSQARLNYGQEIFALSGFHIRTDAKNALIPIELFLQERRIQIWGLPFLSRGDVELPENQEGVYPYLLQKIRESQDPQALQILVAHLFAREGVSSDSERALVGGLGEISLPELEGFDYVALGHLHRRQSLNQKVVYSGSPLAYSFSEAGYLKNWVLGEWEDQDLKVSFLPIEAPRPIARIQGTIESLRNDPQWEQYRDSYLEIELENREMTPGAMGLLRQRFPFLLSLRQKALSALLQGSDSELLEPRGSLEEDFQAFWKFHYQEPPPPGVLKQWSELLEEEE